MNISALDKSIDLIIRDKSPVQKYLTEFYVEVIAVDYMGEKLADIGFLSGISIEAEITFADVNNLIELCDMHSGDLYNMAVDICDADGCLKNTICPSDRNIMYIKNIYIDDKYRGLGIGKYLLDNVNILFLHSFNYKHHTLILKPYPQVKMSTQNSLRDIENASTEDIERLIRFYKKAGYRFIEDSDYMYKNYTDENDELFELLGYND